MVQLRAPSMSKVCLCFVPPIILPILLPLQRSTAGIYHYHSSQQVRKGVRETYRRSIGALASIRGSGIYGPEGITPIKLAPLKGT